MQIINTLIESSNDTYSSLINWNFDGLVNNKTYVLDLYTESQNETGGIGMIEEPTNTFYTDYPELQIKNKPLLTQLLNKAAIQIDWANLYTNTGTITGDYSYINDFIKKGNTALNLNESSSIVYNTSIPMGFQISLIIKEPITSDKIFFQMNDGSYIFGYSQAEETFYLTIDGVTQYANFIIYLTENPLYITLTYNQVIIRQYNIYNKVSNCTSFKVSDIKDLPITFMAQENN